jgi:uncharacterized membrane protein YsdA (DUF1294 family)
MAAGKPNRRTPARRPTIKGTYRPSHTGPIVAGLFLLTLVPGVLLKQVPWFVVAAYFLMTPLTFAAYGMDKQSAREGTWRTPEQSLHLMALCGGWPGALAAQGWLRHKNNKASFQSAFWLTVILNLAALSLANPQIRRTIIEGGWS